MATDLHDIRGMQMHAAIDGMNGKSVEGRTLTVNEAKPRKVGRPRADDRRRASSNRR